MKLSGHTSYGASERIGMHRGNEVRTSPGFTLLEVVIAIAIIAGLLSTIIYTVNTHLDAAGRNEKRTVATMLAWEKMLEVEDSPAQGEGEFDEYCVFLQHVLS
jgi:prepilin-type N-terminal cleavage/methylation domain-containing protein